MLANALVRYRATEQLMAANRAVEHDLAVNVQLQTIGSLIRDAETGQRGYLLSGQEGYLQPYQTASEKLGDALQRLAEMVSDNPEQVQNLQHLREVSDSKLGELHRTIELYRQGNVDGARAVVRSNLGKNDMDEIRATIARMEEIDERLLAQRRQSLKSVELKENTGLVLGLGVGLLGLIAFGWALDRIEMVRERATASIIESEEWLSITLSSIGDAVIATDRDGKVQFLNPVAQRATQYSQQAAKGLPLREVFPIYNEVTRAETENPVDKVIATGMVVGLANHTILVRPDGSEIAIDDSAAPILDREGTVTGVVLVFRDVSGQREIEKAMRISEKLAATGKLAATVAHEINNPLEAASNLLYLLQEETLSAEGRNYLKLAEEQLLRVSHIARQTLAFYRDPRQPEALSLRAVCERVIDLYRPRFSNRGIRISSEYEDGLLVFGTEGELAQVISNLVSNAIDAANNHGSVTVKVARVTQDQAVITVTDDGSGISSAHLTKIFEPFFTTKKDVGTGLGLWVSKGIVEKLGGTIRANSAGENQGASFCITLPLYSESASPPATSVARQQSGEAG